MGRIVLNLKRVGNTLIFIFLSFIITVPAIAGSLSPECRDAVQNFLRPDTVVLGHEDGVSLIYHDAYVLFSVPYDEDEIIFTQKLGEAIATGTNAHDAFNGVNLPKNPYQYSSEVFPIGKNGKPIGRDDKFVHVVTTTSNSSINRHEHQLKIFYNSEGSLSAIETKIQINEQILHETAGSTKTIYFNGASSSCKVVKIVDSTGDSGAFWLSGTPVGDPIGTSLAITRQSCRQNAEMFEGLDQVLKLAKTQDQKFEKYLNTIPQHSQLSSEQWIKLLSFVSAAQERVLENMKLRFAYKHPILNDDINKIFRESVGHLGSQDSLRLASYNNPEFVKSTPYGLEGEHIGLSMPYLANLFRPIGYIEYQCAQYGFFRSKAIDATTTQMAKIVTENRIGDLVSYEKQ